MSTGGWLISRRAGTLKASIFPVALTIALLSSNSAAVAQERPPTSSQQAREPSPSQSPDVLLEFYYNFPLPELVPRGQLFREHAVPVLQEFREAGPVQAWFVAETPIGSSSNLYFSVVLRDRRALQEFQQRFLPCVAQRAGAAWSTLARWMSPEREEVWAIVDMRMPARKAERVWLQQRMYVVSTPKLAAWRRFWDDAVTPLRERSTEAGVLDGWIELRRSAGGTSTWKVLEWYDAWDEIYQFNRSLTADLRHRGAARHGMGPRDRPYAA